MKICINGSRGFTSFERLEKELLSRIPLDDKSAVEIVSGGARGADTLARQFAEKYELSFKEFPANWNKYGKSAGHIRNKEMIDYSDKLISFWDGISRGTSGAITYAKSINKPVEIIRI